jgi:acyl-CoA thioester hydrolase
MGPHHHQVRVHYADTDAMGVVYNSVYLVWFEIGRTEWLRALGTPYREIESRGLALPVTEASLRIRVGARYDELVTIETICDQVRSRRVVFTYRILLESRCLAEGNTVHVPVEMESGRVTRLPDWLAELLETTLPSREP